MASCCGGSLWKTYSKGPTTVVWVGGDQDVHSVGRPRDVGCSSAASLRKEDVRDLLLGREWKGIVGLGYLSWGEKVEASVVAT